MLLANIHIFKTIQSFQKVLSWGMLRQIRICFLQCLSSRAPGGVVVCGNNMQFHRSRALSVCLTHLTDAQDSDTELQSNHNRPRNKPVGLEGKNWKALREKQKLGNAKWEPSKRLTWHQIEHLRNLRRTQPEEWTKSKLARYFGISLPAVSRILHSKFDGSEEMRERQDAKANRQIKERREKYLEKLREQWASDDATNPKPN